MREIIESLRHLIYDKIALVVEREYTPPRPQQTFWTPSTLGADAKEETRERRLREAVSLLEQNKKLGLK